MSEKAPSTSNPPTLLTVPEAAEELRCSIATVYREIAENHLAYHQVRGKKLISRADLAEYLNRSRMTCTPASEIPTYTAAKRKFSEAARSMFSTENFDVKPKPRKSAK